MNRSTHMQIEARLEALGLVLPAPMQVPAGMRLPFTWVRVRGNRAYISGHIAVNPDGSIAQPLGKVGAEVSVEEGYQSARGVALPLVTNGYSDLILEVYGPEVGLHARSSIGMLIPLNAPVNCEAEVEIDGG
jgi:hypothetical protein